MFYAYNSRITVSGNLAAARNEENILSNKITHVLGVIDFVPRYPESVQFFHVMAEDIYDADLLSKWDQTFDFIDSALTNGKVLVHWLVIFP